MAGDLGVGMSTLNKWITASRETDVVSKEDLGLIQENDRLRREIPLPGSRNAVSTRGEEQSRLSLGSYGRPRMTEELKEIGLDVGHRRVGRPLSADLAWPNRLPGNGCVRTPYRSFERANTR